MCAHKQDLADSHNLLLQRSWDLRLRRRAEAQQYQV